MTITEFESTDRQTFIDLCKKFYSSDATIRGYDEEITTKTFDRIMDKHENLWGYLMTDIEKNIAVGYALVTAYWSNEEGGEVIVLDELFIDTLERHKGYAKQFMLWMEDHFSWASAITLEVLTSNKSACELYSKTGFTPDGYTTFTKKPK